MGRWIFPYTLERSRHARCCIQQDAGALPRVAGRQSVTVGLFRYRDIVSRLLTPFFDLDGIDPDSMIAFLSAEQ
jgi:hypothetical protein